MGLEKYYNNIFSNDFIFEVIRGNVPGHGFIRKYFAIQNTKLNTVQDIWDYAATEDIYTYTANTGAEYYIFSSNITDNQWLQLNLLDDDFEVRFEYVQLNGQTPVRVGNKNFTRIYRMFNTGITDFAGNVFCTEGDDVTAGAPNDTTDVRAYIPLGVVGQTQMSHFTIPDGMYGEILGFSGSVVNKATAAIDAKAYVRLFNGVFRVQEYLGLNSTGSSDINRIYTIPPLIPPKTDIKIQADSSALNAGVSGSYGILVFNEEFVAKETNRIDL